MNKKTMAVAFAIFAAALYAINIPFSKILIEYVDATMMAAFLLGEQLPQFIYILAVMILGFLSYGLSINFYIMA